MTTIPSPEPAQKQDVPGDGQKNQKNQKNADGHPNNPPRFARKSDGRLVAGVAAGLAAHLRLQPLTVRIAFSLLSGLSGFGVVLYLALWIFTPSDQTLARQAEEDAPAGIAAATRSGKRRRRSFAQRTGDLGQLAALVMLGVGIAILLQYTPLGISPGLAVPLILAAGGLALVWRTADDRERRRMSALAPKVPWLGSLVGAGGWGLVLRIVLGAVVTIVGLVLFLAQQGQLDVTQDALGGVFIILFGIALIAGPWLWRMWRSLQAERHERIVSQERADMAAHLHDSVLQTLALIQKQAGDSRAVVRLARKQERDLRDWLYGEEEEDGATSVAAALRKIAIEVEDSFGTPIEVVTVGDIDVDGRANALLKATGEAAVNAAKHSGADKVDIFLECEDGEADVFVRDRGAGFDPDEVPEDRLGVRRSIVDRMERHGGSAVVRSTPGEGTEVHVSTRRQS